MKCNLFKNLLSSGKGKKRLGILVGGIAIAGAMTLGSGVLVSSIDNPKSSRIMISREGYPIGYLKTDSNLVFSTYVKRDANSDLGLCMEHIKPAPLNHMYTKGDVITDLGMKHIALSEPNMGSFEEDYYVRQLALNYYQGDVNYITQSLKRGETYRDKAVALAQEAEQVRDGLKQSQYFITDNEIALTAHQAKEFVLNGNYYETDWFNVSHVGDLQEYTVKLKNAPQSIQVLDKNSKVVTKLTPSDNKFKLRLYKGDATKTNNIEVSLDAIFENEEPTRYIPDNSMFQIILLMDSYRIPESSAAITGLTVNPKGNIKLTKVNEKGVKLSNAKFDLYKGNTKVSTGTTNSLGEIIFNDLEIGTYRLVETSSPVGHIISVKETSVEVTGGNTTNVSVTNEIIKGKISIVKTDSEIPNLFIENVEFEIYDNNGNVVDKITTNNNGYAESKLLEYGTYTVKEVKSGKGYHINNTTYTINIAEHNRKYNIDVSNDVYKGNLHIVKIDSENEEVPVEGAGFDIIADDVKGVSKGTVVDHVTTDVDGFAYSNDLRYGVYLIKEVVVPDGFVGSTREYKLNIVEDGKTYVRYIKNDPIEARIRVIKTDGKDKRILSGVKFKIRDKATNEFVKFKEYVGGKVIDKIEFTTDEYGEFVTPQVLKEGIYELVETESLKGYTLLNPITFEINENSPMEHIEAVGNVITTPEENNRIEGGLKLTKVDAYTNSPLPNVLFDIECVEGFMKGKIFRVTTDKNGIAKFNGLEYGRYKVTEICPLEGYVLNAEPTYFNIEENGKIVEVIIKNKPIEGQLEITKIDSEYEFPLTGVEFTIYDINDNEIEKIVTDKDGKAKTSKLIYGQYKAVETKTLDNYNLNKEIIEFSISNEGEVIEKVVKNDIKKGMLAFTKIDKDTRGIVPGATIELTGEDETNKHVKKSFLSLDTATMYNLPIGQYKVKEITAPIGYIKNIVTKKFEVVEEQTVEVSIENKRNPIASTPTGNVTNKPQTGDSLAKDIVTSIICIVSLIAINLIDKRKEIKDRYIRSDVYRKRTEE